MNFIKSIMVAASGLKAQSGRMRVISENIANADSLPRTPGAAPYQRKIPTFRTRFDREIQADTVELGRIRRDPSAFPQRYEPSNPAADANGYVSMPNVSSLVEQMDMRQAQRSYEANLGVVTAARRMIARTIDILRA